MKSLVLLLALVLSLPCSAGILFEPYAGYTMGNLKTSTTATTSTGSIDGFAYGAKLAWSFSGLFIGGEYQAARAKEKLNSSSDVTDWNNTDIFGIVGYQMMNGLRLSYGMTVMPHKSEEAGNPNSTVFEGSAQKASLGFRYRSPFAINVDYVIYDLKDYKTGSIEGKVKDRFDKFTYNAFIISISFPFEVGER